MLVDRPRVALLGARKVLANQWHGWAGPQVDEVHPREVEARQRRLAALQEALSVEVRFLQRAARGAAVKGRFRSSAGFSAYSAESSG